MLENYGGKHGFYGTALQLYANVARRSGHLRLTCAQPVWLVLQRVIVWALAVANKYKLSSRSQLSNIRCCKHREEALVVHAARVLLCSE